MTPDPSIDLLARELYKRYNTALKWLEPDWEFLPDATREVWRRTVTPRMLERLDDEAKLARIRYLTTESNYGGFDEWESIGSAEKRRWRGVVKAFMTWEE